MKTILMTAYDVNPFKGSESGTGWNWAIQASKHNKVKLVTRINNGPEIERYINSQKINISNIQFYYYDLPYFLRFWKKGARGSSFYFYLWRLCLPIYIKKNRIKFDIAHSLNFHSDTYPTFLWVFDKPLVWGPVCHNEKIPNGYLKFGKNFILDRIKWGIKNFIWKFDIFLYLTIKKSSVIIGANSSVFKRLKIKDDKKKKTISYLGAPEVYHKKSSELSKFQIICVGRFLPIKSFDLALDAFNKFYKSKSNIEQENISLLFVGNGPTQKVIKKKAEDLKLNKAVQFLGWIDKNKIDKYYSNSSIFLFPSHEGGGMVVIEALSHSLPVICFDNYGPGEMVNHSCGIKIPYSNYRKSIDDFKNAIDKLYNNDELRNKLGVNALEHFQSNYLWKYKSDILKEIYRQIK